MESTHELMVPGDQQWHRAPQIRVKSPQHRKQKLCVCVYMCMYYNYIPHSAPTGLDFTILTNTRGALSL